MHFCNPNGILQVWLPKPTVDNILPFWVQKGMKSERFLSAENVFEKYRSSAFQNRSQNVSTTSSYDFMPIWSLQKTPKKRGGARKKKSSQGLTCLVPIVVCSHRPWFQSISTHFEVPVVIIMKLFPHTLWRTQIPWFWALVEPPRIAHTELQAPVENFLEVVWP